jgi:tryptophan synthase alpha chain
MNRLNMLFENKSGRILSIFFTAGHPQLNSTMQIICALEDAGADMVEIGMPYSDPIADGPVIQASSKKALENGMSLRVLFDQLRPVRQRVKIPILLMGYLNPVLQYGYEKFCSDAAEVGVDGLILPDMPPEIYVEQFRDAMLKSGLHPVFLISPETSDDRIRTIDQLSETFIYMVSSPSVTGERLQENPEIKKYFERVCALNLTRPRLVGFGISDPHQAEWVSEYAHGVIIGSAFIAQLDQAEALTDTIHKFLTPFKTT